MKKFIVFLVFAAVLVWGYSNRNTGSYSGIYDFRENPNLVLRVNDNDTFTIYNTIGKTSELIKGKYTVDNNNIELVPNKDNIDKSIAEPLLGKVEGSEIKIADLQGEFIKR